MKPLGTPVWHGPIGFGVSRRLGLRAFAKLVVLWGQRTIWSRGHFRERLRVVCGRECLAAATGITRLTREGKMRIVTVLGYNNAVIPRGAGVLTCPTPNSECLYYKSLENEIEPCKLEL